MNKKKVQKNKGLYRPIFEKDNCGFGLISQMDDKPSHWVVDTSINALQRLTQCLLQKHLLVPGLKIASK